MIPSPNSHPETMVKSRGRTVADLVKQTEKTLHKADTLNIGKNKPLEAHILTSLRNALHSALEVKASKRTHLCLSSGLNIPHSSVAVNWNYTQ